MGTTAVAASIPQSARLLQLTTTNIYRYLLACYLLARAGLRPRPSAAPRAPTARAGLRPCPPLLRARSPLGLVPDRALRCFAPAHRSGRSQTTRSAARAHSPLGPVSDRAPAARAHSPRSGRAPTVPSALRVTSPLGPVSDRALLPLDRSSLNNIAVSRFIQQPIRRRRESPSCRIEHQSLAFRIVVQIILFRVPEALGADHLRMSTSSPDNWR